MQDNEPINLTYGQMSDMVNRIEQIPSLSGAGAPTSSTPAFHIGQTYLDTTTDELYYCASIPGENDPLEYTWEEVGSGGGGGATIFYKDSGLVGWGEDIEGPLFYKDSSYQTPATSSDIYAACMAGTTYICSNQSDDLFYTEIVAASNYSTNYNFSLTNIEHDLGYDCTISSYISGGTEYYSFYYNEPSTINVVQTTGSSTTNVMSQNAVTTGLAGKQDTLTAGANITIDANNVISAAGGGSGPTVVQATGTSTTDVMSQNAVTSLVYADPATRTKIKIGDGAYVNEGQDGVEIGHNAKAGSMYAVGIGSSAEAKGPYSVALGYGAESVANGVSLGRGARAQATSAVAFQRSYTTTQGQVQFELVDAASTEGYNNSKYRLLSGLYDPQSAHDAATKGYVDSIAPSITMTTTDPGEGAPLAANHFIGVYQ